MSTSILYHVFGRKGIKYTAAHFVADRIVFSTEMNRQGVRCPICGCRKASFKGKRRRSFFMSPIGRKKCMIELMLHRLKCRSCSALWWPTLPFMIGTRRCVRSFALAVLDMLRFATISSVAEYLGAGWDMVKNIHKERLRFLYRKIPLHNVECIGIDEFSFAASLFPESGFFGQSDARANHVGIIASFFPDPVAQCIPLFIDSDLPPSRVLP